MPQVFNVRHLPGFAEHRPIIPPDAVYLGRRNARYRLPASKWANPFSIKRETDRGVVIAAYERWLRLPPALHELKGRDLVCWCPPALPRQRAAEAVGEATDRLQTPGLVVHNLTDPACRRR